MSRFDDARRAALMQDLLAPITRRPNDLLPFDEVRERLRLRHVVDRGVQDVPLDAIVGSAGREREFTRAFLPREESLRQRWLELDSLARGTRGFPPVELYKVGDVYFVVDGHHRVSVARSLRAPSVEAWVKEFETPVPVSADESIEELILSSGMIDFLEATGLEPERADEFVTTVPNGYERMLEHIAVHRYFLGQAQERHVPWDEAVRAWHAAFYRPITERVRESGILEDFPGCTEADLYLFTMDHLHVLRERFGPHAVPPERAATHFALMHQRMTDTRWERFGQWWRRLWSRRPWSRRAAPRLGRSR